MTRRANRDSRPLPPDWEKFRLGVGIGGMCIAVGTLIGWAVLTSPPGVGSHPGALTTSQRLARMLPDALQEKIALVMAGLFVLFGTLVFLGGLTVIWDYLRYRFGGGEIRSRLNE
ncbi:MAG: hypothetical protein HQM03_17665 [Magnetococcales bacterium]|nr:hypothetical protein [Magnetococcales bacterium]